MVLKSSKLPLDKVTFLAEVFSSLSYNDLTNLFDHEVIRLFVPIYRRGKREDIFV